jgi:predicted hydrocarbon binding protein
MSESTNAVPAAGGGEDGATHAYANKIGRIVFLSLEDVAGEDNMRAILSAARLHDRLERQPPNDFERGFAFDELGRMQRALVELYGPLAGRRLARRMGRVSFRLGAQDLRPVLGVADLVFRILPLRTRLRVGFEVLAQMFERFSDQSIELEENEEYFRWVMTRCGVCWGRRSDGPCCDLMVGLLQEAVHWLSGGAQFFIEESSCIAAGESTCTILIGKQPVVGGEPGED